MNSGDHLSHSIQKDFLFKAWSKCKHPGWNLSDECLTSAQACKNYLCPTIEYQAEIKGTDGSKVMFEHPVMSAGNSGESINKKEKTIYLILQYF
jgi:hypothetical protein